MPLPSLAELIKPPSFASIQALMSTVGGLLGLQQGSWPVDGQANAVWNLAAQLVTNYGINMSKIAQGGSPTLASLMLDVLGHEDPTWQDAISQEMYLVKRQPASFASGLVPIRNTGALQAFDAGKFHLLNPGTGATYTNPAPIIVTPGLAGYNMQADQAGSAGTASAGTTLVMVTPVIGFTIEPLALGLVGIDAQGNQSYLRRCYASLGALSPCGHPLAYYFYATGTMTPSGQPVTRAQVLLNAMTGAVSVYVANPDGGLSSPDIAAVQAAIAPAVADPFLATVFTVAVETFTPTGTFYLPTALLGLLDDAEIIAAAENALTEYVALAPIGGVAGVLPLSGIEAALVQGATQSVRDQGADPTGIVLELTAPTRDVPVPKLTVATLLSPSFSVVYA